MTTRHREVHLGGSIRRTRCAPGRDSSVWPRSTPSTLICVRTEQSMSGESFEKRVALHTHTFLFVLSKLAWLFSAFALALWVLSIMACFSKRDFFLSSRSMFATLFSRSSRALMVERAWNRGVGRERWG